jgi:hypothetical protein
VRIADDVDGDRERIKLCDIQGIGRIFFSLF